MSLIKRQSFVPPDSTAVITVCGPCSADVFCYSVIKLITIPLSLAECFDPVDWQTLYYIGKLKLFFQHLTFF
jgi:hypothetical protein